MRRILALAAGLAAGITAAAAARRLTRFEIAESSMVPALRPGDYVLAARLRGRPRRGDVVVFEHPGRPGFELVKRVVGLPGETVELVDGRLEVNGLELAEPWARGPARPDGRWELGPGELFMLGDHRELSADDGRAIGPVALDGELWRVVARYWPPDRVGSPV